MMFPVINETIYTVCIVNLSFITRRQIHCRFPPSYIFYRALRVFLGRFKNNLTFKHAHSQMQIEKNQRKIPQSEFQLFHF